MTMRLWGGIGILLVGCAAAIGCVTTGYHQDVSMGMPAPAVAPEGGSDQPFYDDLAPYGHWVFVAGPGWVWSPYNLQAGWRPYQLGHWVFTDYGWTWASDEQWGWAVYHYGRWHLDPSHGWVWVPGTEWGPAWVAWHEGGGYVGWAPLPWQVRFRAGVGLDWAGANVTIQTSWWSFVNTRNLVDPGLRTYIVPPSRNVTLINVTKNVTNYTYIDNRIVNQGVKVETIGKAVGRTIPRYRLTQDDTPGAVRGGKVKGQEFIVFKPNPGRGVRAHGQPTPPGHELRDRPRGWRESAEQTEENLAPGTTPAAPAPETGQPDQTSAESQPPGNPNPPGHNRPDPNPKSRGRRFLDELAGKPAPRQGPRESPPSQTAAPSQSGAPSQSSGPSQSTPPDQRSAPTASPAETRPGATTPPASPSSERGQSARERAEKAKQTRDAATKGKKPKQNEPKSEGSNSDESKEDKPESSN
jgi:hypothetical protein